MAGNLSPASRGTLYALASAGLFGASTPAAHQLLGDVSPWLLAGVLYLGSGLGLGLVRAATGFRAPKVVERPLRREDWTILGVAVFLGGILSPTLLMLALTLAPPATVSLLLNGEGFFTLLLAYWVFKEPRHPGVVLAGLFFLLGGLILAWRGGSPGMGVWGLSLVTAACLGWALDNNLTRKIANRDALQIAHLKGLVAGLANTALALVFGARLPGWRVLSTAAMVGFAGYGVSLWLFVLALRHAGAARTGICFSCAPLVGAIVSVAIGAEPPHARLLLAAVPFMAGVGFLMTYWGASGRNKNAVGRPNEH